MKKEYKIIIAVILVVWIFAMGWVLGKDNGYDLGKEEVLATATTPAVTNPPIIPDPTTTTSLVASTVPPTQSQPAVTDPLPTTPLPPVVNDDPASLSTAQVVEKMNTYMAQLKSEQNMSAHKVESIKVKVDSCSVAGAESILNSVIDSLAGDETKDYTFSGGVSGTDTPNGVIPPTNKAFNLTEASVVSATATKQGDSTVYKAVLAQESTTLTSPVPAYNSTAIGYLDLATIELPSIITLEAADLQYPGSIVEITVDGNGKVTKLLNNMPMSGYGQASIKLLGSGNASFSGALDETWTFTY